MAFASIPEALTALQSGKMIILVDDEHRENEGDLTIAAEFATPAAINFMATHAKGLICLSLASHRVDQLSLPMMTQRNESQFGTPFTVSIEARKGVSTGISAFDRATTIATAIADEATPQDLVMPGHVFPLRAKDGGVLARAGQTEGSVDLARLAGLKPAAVICEIMREDGQMARVPDLEIFAKKHNLLIVTIQDLIQYRLRHDQTIIHRISESRLPTKSAGEFKVIAFESNPDNLAHIALIKGTISPHIPTLVRVHSECLTGDVFGSLRCDCGDQLKAAMQMIHRAGSGVILYMRQEGRGIGLLNKIRAYQLQDEGLDTLEANQKLGFPDDLRDYGIGAQILLNLGVRKLRLLTNNPKKIIGLSGFGLELVERVALTIEPCESNYHYLQTKKNKMGHLIHEMDSPSRNTTEIHEQNQSSTEGE